MLQRHRPIANIFNLVDLVRRVDRLAHRIVPHERGRQLCDPQLGHGLSPGHQTRECRRPRPPVRSIDRERCFLQRPTPSLLNALNRLRLLRRLLDPAAWARLSPQVRPQVPLPQAAVSSSWPEHSS
jgi:hypothetical protein